MTVYPVIGEPPLSGSFQLIVIMSGDWDQVVIGVPGVDGTKAARISTASV